MMVVRWRSDQRRTAKRHLRLFPMIGPTPIKRTIIATPHSQIVAVTLGDIPVDNGQIDRTVYYCRFDEPMTET